MKKWKKKKTNPCFYTRIIIFILFVYLFDRFFFLWISFSNNFGFLKGNPFPFKDRRVGPKIIKKMWRKNKKKKKKEEQKIDCMIGVWVIKKKNGEKWCFFYIRFFDFWLIFGVVLLAIFVRFIFNCLLIVHYYYSFSIDKDLWTEILFFSIFGFLFLISYLLDWKIREPIIFCAPKLKRKIKKKNMNKQVETSSLKTSRFSFFLFSNDFLFALKFCTLFFLDLFHIVSFIDFFVFVFYFPFVVILRGFYWLNWIFSLQDKKTLEWYKMNSMILSNLNDFLIFIFLRS